MNKRFNCNNEKINKVITSFTEKQLSYGNVLTDYQTQNITNLTKLLFDENIDRIPIVVDIPMGQGKSSLIA